jgi:hypothetical protein
LLLRFKTSDDLTMSDHRIMIGRSLCRNFAHHCPEGIGNFGK